MEEEFNRQLTQVEDIFNRLRYKYLSAFYQSGTTSPAKFLSYDRNYLVGALLNDRHTVYERVGITREICQGLCFENEINELHAVFEEITSKVPDNLEQVYAEMIALKPGFHELIVHTDYFEDALNYEPQGPRKQVFSILRGREPFDSLKLAKWPEDVEATKFLKYAPCNITEGPIVTRRASGVSYLDENAKVTSPDRLSLLDQSFNIIRYHNIYLFDLRSIDSDHTEQARLSAYLRETHNIQLAQDAPITKSDDNRKVTIGNGGALAAICFSEDFRTASLTSGDFQFDGFNVVHDRGGYIYLYHATVRNRDALKAVLKAAKPLLHLGQG